MSHTPSRALTTLLCIATALAAPMAHAVKGEGTRYTTKPLPSRAERVNVVPVEAAPAPVTPPARKPFVIDVTPIARPAESVPAPAAAVFVAPVAAASAPAITQTPALPAPAAEAAAITPRQIEPLEPAPAVRETASFEAPAGAPMLPTRPEKAAVPVAATPEAAPEPVPAAPAAPAPAAPRPGAPNTNVEPLIQLGVGDAVKVEVFGRPEFNTTAYVADDMTVTVPLAGKVKVAGLSPADASAAIAKALRDGQFLVNPQVSIALSSFTSQQVSVLGEVQDPGRFPIQSRSTVLDLLAQAGGVLEGGGSVVYLIRPGKDGQMTRTPIDLKGLGEGRLDLAQITLKGGDSLYVPRAEQFYVYGEVNTPNMYRLEPGTTVVQAITRSGGITTRGSQSRIEIKRRKQDGSYETLDAELTDEVKPNDVIRVKERIF